MAQQDGKWITINGKHVFIPRGKKLEDVWDYQSGKSKEDNYEEDLSDSVYEGKHGTIHSSKENEFEVRDKRGNKVGDTFTNKEEAIKFLDEDYDDEDYEEDIDELSMSGMSEEEKEIYKAHKDEIDGDLDEKEHDFKDSSKRESEEDIIKKSNEVNGYTFGLKENDIVKSKRQPGLFKVVGFRTNEHGEPDIVVLDKINEKTQKVIKRTSERLDGDLEKQNPETGSKIQVDAKLKDKEENKSQEIYFNDSSKKEYYENLEKQEKLENDMANEFESVLSDNKINFTKMGRTYYTGMESEFPKIQKIADKMGIKVKFTNDGSGYFQFLTNN